MKKNKWVLLLIAFVAFLVLVYFIGACLNATAEALTIISLCIGILVIYLVVKATIRCGTFCLFAWKGRVRDTGYRK